MSLHPSAEFAFHDGITVGHVGGNSVVIDPDVVPFVVDAGFLDLCESQ
jgi:hypothetical protein